MGAHFTCTDQIQLAISGFTFYNVIIDSPEVLGGLHVTPPFCATAVLGAPPLLLLLCVGLTSPMLVIAASVLCDCRLEVAHPARCCRWGGSSPPTLCTWGCPPLTILIAS